MDSGALSPIQTKHLKISNIHRLYTRLYAVYRRFFGHSELNILNILKSVCYNSNEKIFTFLTYINVKYLHVTKFICKFVT